ncbi:MAG TPA: DoxX family protein [Acidobacteriaceae bacterium]|nr:DoxX family protein [Acidobacteriaceae bacterium]
MQETPKSMLWSGRILSTIATLFMIMDGTMKIFKPPFVIQTSAQLGYAESLLPGIGIALLFSTAVYIVPRTSILGALLLTGYLGGAVASNVRSGAPLFNTLFPIIFAFFVWGGLWLRDPRLRALLPFTPDRSPNYRAVSALAPKH